MSEIFSFYIDESGDHTYGRKELRKFIIKTKDTPIELPDNYYPELKSIHRRYFGLTGCIIERKYYRISFHPELEKLKQRHFPHNPDEPVILHRNDIVNKRGPFWRLTDPSCEKEFNEDLLSFFKNMEYKLITVVIDKKAHIERYQEHAFHPYHFCLTAILERYCGFLHFCNATGDVCAESRGGREDDQLKAAYRNVYNNGTQFRVPTFFQKVLTSKEIKLKKKKANIAGLQFVDLVAHPVKNEILSENQRVAGIDSEEKPFGRKICNIVREKHNKHHYTGRIYGYGKILLK